MNLLSRLYMVQKMLKLEQKRWPIQTLAHEVQLDKLPRIFGHLQMLKKYCAKVRLQGPPYLGNVVTSKIRSFQKHDREN